MADIIKMNYPLMEAMAYAFDSGSETLETTVSEMNNVAQLLADGALIGMGGDAYVEAVQSALVPSIQRLQEKLNELEKDVIDAMEKMKQEDAGSAALYSN